MIKCFVSHSDIIALEPSLEQLKAVTEINFDAKITEAKKILEAWYKNNGKELKSFAPTLTIPNDDTISGIDNVERLRLVIEVTEITDNAYGTLYGNNDASDNYSVVKNDIVISETGTYTSVIDNPFYYYKLDLTGTITFISYLVEDVFELPLKYLTIALIYKANIALGGDVYQEKSDYYMSEFKDAFNNTLFAYDRNLDGDIVEEEKETPRVRFTL